MAYVKEIFVFAVLIVSSAVFWLIFFLELNLPKPLDWISFCWKPVHFFRYRLYYEFL